MADDSIPSLDGYQYVSTLGRGGFSDVYLFQQRFPRRKVAVKVLRVDELDADLRRQFVAEANVMARLSSHPAIATIFAADISAAGDPYLVMEYYARGSLGTGYRDTPLSVEDVLRHGVRIATALEHAHRAGVVHRDVKPANILLNDYGAVMLTDFGISVGDDSDGETTVIRTAMTSVESQTSNAGSHGVSIPWAPPEALLDVPKSNSQSDIYSLGATLYTLLEGRTPFEIAGASNAALQLSRRIERGDIGEFAHDAPEELRSALRTMMAIDPRKRQKTAQAVAETLQAVQREQGFAVTPIELHDDAVGTLGFPATLEASADMEPTHKRSRTQASDKAHEIDVETITRERAGSPQHRRGWITRRTLIAAGSAVVLGLALLIALPLVTGGSRIDGCSRVVQLMTFEAAAAQEYTVPQEAWIPELRDTDARLICGINYRDNDAQILLFAGDELIAKALRDRLEEIAGWACDYSRCSFEFSPGVNRVVDFSRFSRADANTIEEHGGVVQVILRGERCSATLCISRIWPED